jgi:hypothetical protein
VYGRSLDVKIKVMLRPRSVGQSSPIWGPRPDLYYCQIFPGLLMSGAFSDERTCLSFTIDAGPRQRSHSVVRVPLESRLYFSQGQSYFMTGGLQSISSSWRQTHETHDQSFFLTEPLRS